MYKHSPDELKTLATLCASVALMVALGVFLSAGSSTTSRVLAQEQLTPQTQTAGWFSSFFSHAFAPVIQVVTQVINSIGNELNSTACNILGSGSDQTILGSCSSSSPAPAPAPAPPPQPVLSLAANTTQVANGQSVTLTYAITNAQNITSCSLSGGEWGSGTTVGTSGSKPTSPLTQSTTYTYACQDSHYGAVNATPLTVTVSVPLACTTDTQSSTLCGLSASSPAVLLGDPVTLTWNCPSGGTYTSSQGDSHYSTGGALSGSTQQTPQQTTEYQVSCIAPSGTSIGTATVAVEEPALSIVAPTRVQKGETATLSWNIGNLSQKTSCSITSVPAGIFTAVWGGAGTSWIGTNVQTTEAIESQTVFTVSCATVAGTVSNSATVMLVPQYQEQ